LNRRLDERPEDEWGGKTNGTRTHCAIASNERRHSENGIIIDATAPLARVVDEIVRQSEANTTLVN
jgi:hypothetical protein